MAWTADNIPRDFSAGLNDRDKEEMSENGSSFPLSFTGCDKSILSIAWCGTATEVSDDPSARKAPIIPRINREHSARAAIQPMNVANKFFKKSFIYLKFLNKVTKNNITFAA
jgi:hypothetical protein